MTAAGPDGPAGRYGGWAVVAGASAGLGAAFATEAARLGFDVVLVARRGDVLEETAATIRAATGRATRCVTADLASADAADVIAAATADLDVGVLIYNAAAEPEGRFVDMDVDDDRLNLAVNCLTPTLLTRAVARRMVERGRGAIVLVSSMAALQGIKWFTTYGAAKAYELILAEGLWHELAHDGVDVVGYVVGATASTGFRGVVDDDVYAGASAGASKLTNRILRPATSEEVAARLFPRLHLGPRQYSHDTDELAAQEAAAQPRDEVVRAMGEVTVGLGRFQHLRDAGYR